MWVICTYTTVTFVLVNLKQTKRWECWVECFPVKIWKTRLPREWNIPPAGDTEVILGWKYSDRRAGTSLSLLAASQSSRDISQSSGQPGWGSTWEWCRTGWGGLRHGNISTINISDLWWDNSSGTSRFGVRKEGLFQETSFQPRSSASIKIMLGDLEITTVNTI